MTTNAVSRGSMMHTSLRSWGKICPTRHAPPHEVLAVESGMRYYLGGFLAEERLPPAAWVDSYVAESCLIVGSAIVTQGSLSRASTCDGDSRTMIGPGAAICMFTKRIGTLFRLFVFITAAACR